MKQRNEKKKNYLAPDCKKQHVNWGKTISLYVYMFRCLSVFPMKCEIKLRK